MTVCGCINACNQALAEHNARLDTSFVLCTDKKAFFEVLMLPLKKVDAKKRKKLPSLTCTYCPMCGKKLTK